MANLFDSCSLIKISDENTLLKLAKYSKDFLKSKIAITNVILNELFGHAQKENIPAEDFYSFQNHLCLYIKSKDIIKYDLEQDKQISNNYKKIRKNTIVG